MKLEHIKAIAFDLDGTLVDSLPDLIAAANAMRAHLDMPALQHARIREHVGDGIASLVHRAITDERDALAPHDQWEQGYRFFVQYYRDHLTVHTTVYPGVTTGLGLLKALNLPLAVVTNKSERLAQPLLQELALADDFALILGGDTLAEKKPSALPLLHVSQAFGVQPGELLMVGDSANDVLAARNAGCPVALMRYGYADADSLNADLTLDSLETLYDLIKPATPAI
ncbi:MAG: phosphoglycolate phosphatase [Paludibacterium sp.]|uniref:phosphoglycolate phosphatase n=1 Tax=Paludibacterium sp. TaxID=1917523 RepID=UPI0025DCD9A3|nr:phosphoglycolate phosphatase [Paludibacterium sp.]MBV8047048.1 phosphoglycolate phosphatase [Paludibacterium sp.]MBV8646406.1 phosphoglycolate phosphatase [Paludibacterium sp.]